MNFRKNIIIVLFILIQNTMYSQSSLTNAGREFWVGYGSSLTIGKVNSIGILITAYQQTNIKIVSEFGEQNYQIPANSPLRITFDSTKFKLKGIQILSESDVIVTAFDAAQTVVDATMVLPLEVLGVETQYTFNRYKGSRNKNKLLFVAPNDNTEILISNSSNFENYTIYTLNKFETMEIPYLNNSPTLFAKSGISDKPFVVYYVNECEYVGPCGACDNLYLQVIPDNKLGFNYVAMPLSLQNAGYIITLTGIQDQSVIYFEDSISINLNRGEQFEYDVKSDRAVCISSNKPISVFQLMKGSRCHNPIVNGDPAIVQLNDNQQMLTQVVFSTLKGININKHYIHILVKSNAIDQLFINGKKAKDSFELILLSDCKDYAIIRGEIPDGVHTISCDKGFIGYAMGIGSFESYLYTLGTSFFDVGILNVIKDKQYVCPGDSVMISIESTNIPFHEIWIEYNEQKDSGNKAICYFPEKGEAIINIYFRYSENEVLNTYKYFVDVKAKPLAIYHFESETFCLKGNKILFNNTCETYDIETSYKWNFSDYDSSEEKNPFFQFPGDGKHDVTLSAQNIYGCSDDYSDSVIIYPQNSFDISSDSVCIGESTTLNAELFPAFFDSTQFIWNLSDGATYRSSIITHQFKKPGLYDVHLEVTNKFGCKDTLEKSGIVLVRQNPDFDFIYHKIADSLEFSIYKFEIKNNGFIPFQNHWLINNYYNDTSASPHITLDSGINEIKLTVWDTFGCKNSYVNLINVIPESYVYIPNAFSPNGDGLNDLLTFHFHNIISASIMIMNRWGEMILVSNNINFEWDGTYKGMLCSDGIYTVIIQYDTIRNPGKMLHYKGNVHLLR